MKAILAGHVIAESEDIVECDGYQYFPSSAVRTEWLEKAQKTESEWDTFLDAHRQRVEETSDEDYEDIGKFLKSHFNPDNPVPQLPPELENYTLPPA